MLSGYPPYTRADQVLMGNGSSIVISSTGSSQLSPHRTLSNALHVPNIKRNILSVSKLTHDHHCSFEFFPHGLFVKELFSGCILMKDDIYVLNGAPSSPICQLLQTSSSQLWHRRLGHPSTPILHHALVFTYIQFPHNNKRDVCSACQHGKLHSSPFTLSSTTATRPLEFVSANIWGPSPIVSHGGFRYYVLFVDYYSHFN